MGRILIAVIRRDLLLAWRRRSDALTTLLFFVIVASLFPLGVGPEPELLRAMATGVVWVGALLASMLALPRLFAADHADGTLEQLLLIGQPPAVWVLGKSIAHWLVSGAPLVLCSPLLALLYDMPAEGLPVLMITLLIGTPCLSLIGAIGAGLTLGVRGGGVLLALLVLPLYIPVLIFGAGAVEAALAGLDPQAHLSLLGALLVFSLVAAAPATVAALRISLE
jgi:heme exporter protein B